VPDTADSPSSYLADLLKETREELTRADSKAALLLAATGVAAGALLAGLLGGRWTPFSLDNRVEWIWWIGVCAAGAGIVSIAAAVYPRIRRRQAPDPQAPAFFADVAAYDTIEAFRRAVAQAFDPESRLIDQTYLLSRTVQTKYVFLRRGLRLLLLAILACAGAVGMNALLAH
jgi:MFS family permease